MTHEVFRGLSPAEREVLTTRGGWDRPSLGELVGQSCGAGDAHPFAHVFLENLGNELLVLAQCIRFTAKTNGEGLTNRVITDHLEAIAWRAQAAGKFALRSYYAHEAAEDEDDDQEEGDPAVQKSAPAVESKSDKAYWQIQSAQTTLQEFLTEMLECFSVVEGAARDSAIVQVATERFQALFALAMKETTHLPGYVKGKSVERAEPAKAAAPVAAAPQASSPPPSQTKRRFKPCPIVLGSWTKDLRNEVNQLLIVVDDLYNRLTGQDDEVEELRERADRYLLQAIRSINAIESFFEDDDEEEEKAAE